MTDALRAELDQLWAAIRALSENDNAHYANIKRMNARMMLHEAYAAIDQMQEPGRTSH